MNKITTLFFIGILCTCSGDVDTGSVIQESRTCPEPPSRCWPADKRHEDLRCAVECTSISEDWGYCPDWTPTETNSCSQYCVFLLGQTTVGLYLECLYNCLALISHVCTAGVEP